MPYTEAQIIAIGGSPWEKDGKRRVYLNDITALYIAGYGERPSNNRLRQVSDKVSAVYLDCADGEIVIRSREERFDDTIWDGVAALVAELPPAEPEPAEPETETAPAAGWQERVRNAHDAAEATRAAEEQAVRDAHAAGATPTEIAAALGVKNRQRVYAIIGGETGNPRRAPMTPVAFLRGAGMADETWDRVQRAMWARGIATTRDRKAAWCLARGGVPVVMVDFSGDLDDNPPAPGGGHFHGYNRFARVGLVRARYGVTRRPVMLGSLLNPEAEDAITAAGHAEVLETRVEREHREEQLVLVSGGDRYEPWGGTGHLDADMLGRLAAEALDR